MLPDEITAYLAGAGLGLVVGTNLFRDHMPATEPHAAVAITVWNSEAVDTFGESLSAPAYEIQNFKVIVRDDRDKANAARVKAYAIYKKLRRLGPVTLSGVKYHNIKANPPAFLSDDEADRPRFHFDAVAFKAESPS